MKRTTCLLIVGLLMITTSIVFTEPAPQKVVDYANANLVILGTDPVIVNAVKAENAKGKSLDQIKAADAVWSETTGISDEMKALMASDCGKHLSAWRADHDFVSEIFVMDNQGANVAMTDKTSDYWQGDEDKFIKCYNSGNGTVFISDVDFDESAQVYQVQVSVPVKDGDATIGAICIGIDLDLFE